MRRRSASSEPPPAAAVAPPAAGDDPELAALTAAYLGARKRDCEELPRRLAAGDFPWIARLGHRLKGSGSSYGFPALSAAGDELEQAARQRDATRCRAGAQRLVALLDSL